MNLQTTIACVLFMLISQYANAQNLPPIANDDLDTTYSGGQTGFFALDNDSDPNGDSLFIDTVLFNPQNSVTTLFNGFYISYEADHFYNGLDTLYYVVCDVGIPSMCDTGRIFIYVSYVIHPTFEHLDINMVQVRYNAHALDVWNPFTGAPGYEVPKGSGKNMIWESGIWIGGLDDQNKLHMAAQRYPVEDIYPGPIMDSTKYSYTQDSLWNRLWKVNKSTIDSHIIYVGTPGYSTPEAIIDWPAHGDVSKGQAYYLAPFFDVQGDDNYDPLQGDYPLIRGDQAIYFIRNDHRGPNSSGAGTMKVEIHGMAYAYDCPQDSALAYTTFVNYKIVNRSANNYHNVYFGANVDFDIGDASDDYVECDVSRGGMFAFNGLGSESPAQGLFYLKGPKLDIDGIDNVKGNCDAGINGYGFDDGIIDNETMGMTGFISYCNSASGGCNGAIQGGPDNADECYKYLQSRWLDSTQMAYGGNGHINNCSSCEPTNFMYPDNTDSCHWGTNSIVPADSTIWNGSTSGNQPSDFRGISSSGPFSFLAGDTLEVDLAYVYGKDYSDNSASASILNMKERIDSISSYFLNDYTPCGTFFLSMDNKQDIEQKQVIVVHPNPANDYIKIDNLPSNPDREFQIYDLTGRIMLRGTLHNMTANISDLPRGVFIIAIQGKEIFYRAKFVRI